MARELDYHSSEYDELLDEARRVGWNDDRLSSSDHERAQRELLSYVRTTFYPSDEVDRITRAIKGECY